MKRPVDIKSIYALSNKNTNILSQYYKYLGLPTGLKEQESLLKFLAELPDGCYTDCCYLDYSIPQISKEFDLLRFSPDKILNIEFKSRAVSKDKIKQQLLENKYYLSALSRKEMTQFTYVVGSPKGTVYELGSDDSLITSSIEQIAKKLDTAGERIPNIDSLFNPTQFLVSPFNDTDRFLKNEYFLTDQQRNFKSLVFNSQEKLFSISGSAGTGKTLLAYDIAKTAILKNKNVCVVHCGRLNEGHQQLCDQGWTVWSLRKFMHNYSLMDEFDFIVIDEVQRISPTKVTKLIDLFLTFNAKILFSGDSKQWLHKSENGDQTFANILGRVSKQNQVTLSKKMRTNAALASFIKEFFNLNDKTQHDKINSNYVYCEYFSDSKSAKEFAMRLDESGWTVINQTTSLYNSEFYDSFNQITCLNSHTVIGQEFERVAVFVGPGYTYENGKLTGKGTYYHLPKLLFENLTRARKEVFLIFIDNTSVFQHCIELLAS